jgi:hypothetical protein
MLKDDQNRLVQQYQSTFTKAVAIQTRGMAEVEESVRNVVESLNYAYGGFEEVRNTAIDRS